MGVSQPVGSFWFDTNGPPRFHHVVGTDVAAEVARLVAAVSVPLSMVGGAWSVRCAV
jgi:hypothetical protein